MGFQAYVNGLSPIAYYTFDTNSTYINSDTGDGVYINSIDSSAPTLSLAYTSIIGNVQNLNPKRPSLIETEMGSYYRSFCTTIPTTSQLYYIDSNKNMNYYTIGNYSANATGSSDEFQGMIDKDEITIYFQLQLGKVNDNIINGSPLVYYTKNIENPTSYFGMYSACSLQPYDSDGNMIVDPKNPDNTTKLDSSSWDVTIPPKNCTGEIVNNDNTFITVGGINVATRSDNGSTVSIYINGVYLCDQNFNDIVNYTLIYTKATQHIKAYANMNPINEINIIESVGSNDIQVGCNTQYNFYKTDKDGNSIYKLTHPKYVYTIDNFSIYDKRLQENDIYTLYIYTLLMLNRYKSCGFQNLYQFKDLYNDYTYYIMNKTSLYNYIGNTILYVASRPLLSTQTTTDTPLPYVSNIIDQTITFSYYIRLTKLSSLITTRDSNNPYWGNRYDITFPLIGGDKYTLSFYFRTTDLNGNLFSNTLYETVNGNISLTLSSGNLVIYTDSIQRTTITSINDGEFHHIYITCDGSKLYIYVDFQLYYSGISTNIYNSMCVFGDTVSGNNGLLMDISMVASSFTYIPIKTFMLYSKTYLPYNANGKVTLNNVGIDSNIFVYNNDNGELLEKVNSSALNNGTFTYINNYPYTISIVVSSRYNNQKTYIVSPINIK